MQLLGLTSAISDSVDAGPESDVHSDRFQGFADAATLQEPMNVAWPFFRPC